MTRSGEERNAPEVRPERGGCRSWGLVLGALLIGVLVCLGGSVVGLALGGVLMLEGYRPELPSGPATATITRVPTPAPTTRAAPTATDVAVSPTATVTLPPTWTATATPDPTDFDTLRSDDGTGTRAATPTDTLTPIGAPARTATPTAD